jgi:hypothetical protein
MNKYFNQLETKLNLVKSNLLWLTYDDAKFEKNQQKVNFLKNTYPHESYFCTDLRYYASQSKWDTVRELMENDNYGRPHGLFFEDCILNLYEYACIDNNEDVIKYIKEYSLKMNPEFSNIDKFLDNYSYFFNANDCYLALKNDNHDAFYETCNYFLSAHKQKEYLKHHKTLPIQCTPSSMFNRIICGQNSKQIYYNKINLKFEYIRYLMEEFKINFNLNNVYNYADYFNIIELQEYLKEHFADDVMQDNTVYVSYKKNKYNKREYNVNGYYKVLKKL